MKSQISQKWPAALLALVFPVLAGCAANSEADTPTPPQPTNAAPAVSAPDATNTSSDAGAEAAETAQDAEDIAPPEHPEPAPGSDTRPVPGDLKLSPGTAEIAKLARAGINETVLLAFVTNSTGTFNLGSDQIVYLNDLGVSSDVIAAMIEHDRLLREGGGVLPPLAGAPAPQAAAPAQSDAAAVAAAAAPQALPGASATYTSAPPPAATTEPVSAPVTNVTYNYFYQSLAPYGTWVEVDGYGYCWQPSVVVVHAGWRPYLHGGRWIYTDYGWYWHSDYSWGWAPFHYGRWFVHPRWGWVWWPDTVWGPAWVTWRYTDGYCGWAPLPPAARWVSGVGLTYYGRGVSVSFGFGLGWSSFAFVPWAHFHDYHPHRHILPPHRVPEIHRHSTPVTHVVARGDRPIHRGIGEERVRQHTGAELRPIRVREERVVAPATRLSPGERLERGRGELVVRRPHLPPAATPPVADLRNREHVRGAVIRGSEHPTAAATEPAAKPPAAKPAVPSVTSSRPAETPAAGKRGTSGGPPAPRGTMERPQHKEPPAPAGTPAPTRPGGPPRKQTLAASTVTPAAAPASSGSSAAFAKREERRADESGSKVTVIGRRDTPTVSPTGRPVERPAPLNRPNATYTWTRPTAPRDTAGGDVSPNATRPNAPSHTAPTAKVTPTPVVASTPKPAPTPQPAPKATATQIGTPARSDFSRPETTRSPLTVAPGPRPEVRPTAPQAPVNSPSVVHFPGSSRPSVAPAPAPVSRPAPSGPVIVPAARPTPPSAPAPSYSPPAPRSAPAPAPSPSGRSSYSTGGGPRSRQER